MTILRILVAIAWLGLGGCKDRPNQAVKAEVARLAALKAQPTAAPQVSEAEASKALASGQRLRGCNTANVQATVKPKRPEVIQCYRKLLAKQPKATGRLAVEIHIDISGRAKFLGVKSNTFNDEAFAKCVFDVLRPLEYPIPEREPCVVVYPYSFVK